jgi:hypothetical protein
MNPQAVIATINTIITIAGAAVQLGRDVTPFAQAIYDTFVGGREVSQEDLDNLQARVDALHAELQEPLPPE